MTEYNERDLVEAVKGERVLRGRVMLLVGVPLLPTHSDEVSKALSIQWLINQGWTVTTIERATPPLPTEPGWYLTSDDVAVYLADDGYWTVPSTYGQTGEEMAKYGPFTRLEPVPVTAKRVLDAVSTFAWADGFTAQLETVAKRFGVTEP